MCIRDRYGRAEGWHAGADPKPLVGRAWHWLAWILLILAIPATSLELEGRSAFPDFQANTGQETVIISANGQDLAWQATASFPVQTAQQIYKYATQGEFVATLDVLDVSNPASEEVKVPAHVENVPASDEGSLWLKPLHLFNWPALFKVKVYSPNMDLAAWFSNPPPELHDDDDYFVQQRLRGANPNAMRALTSKDRHLVNQALHKRGSGQLPDANATYELYVCDYTFLSNYSSQLPEEGPYVPAPLAVFQYSKGKFTPTAILFDSAGRYEGAMLYDHDKAREGHWELAKTWEFAKMCVRVADWIMHELGAHLTLTHFVTEVSILAARRNLPKEHPVFQLLRPHFHETLPLNALARKDLVPNIIAHKLTPFTDAQCESVCKAIFFQWRFEDHYADRDLAIRQVNGLPADLYPYGETARQVWNILKKYVTSVLTSLESVDPAKKPWVHDGAITAFLKDLADEHIGFAGFPQKVNTKESLAEVLTLSLIHI
eukprot:TRINITY_DN10523_c0_g1_i2.p1 TRINITY_DN10523_c0_g1~~TRINITY_DN10523_c0_g1_i2.p1  ORF type:complete len:489 (+),score=90.85 TRINITY_DN10523_c0_g1_i2:80-1546(+)